MVWRHRLAWGLRLAAVRYRFQESLALFPALMMVAGIVLAKGAIAADKALGSSVNVPLTLSMSSNSAIWLLATVAGAMMTTAGVVFSLTIVSLQLASEQFSPRVMRSFIRDRLSQMVIGLLVATFFYCVLILPTISGGATDPAPPVSLTVAVILTLVTVLGIVVHLDHLSRGLQVGNLAGVISMEGQKLAAAFDEVPEGLRQVEAQPAAAPEDALRIRSRCSGWVSQMNRGQILQALPPIPACVWKPGWGPTSIRGRPCLSFGRRRQNAARKNLSGPWKSPRRAPCFRMWISPFASWWT